MLTNSMQKIFQKTSRLHLFLALAALAVVLGGCDQLNPPTLGW